ncbi:hypothetical protein [Pseudonocardia sp.]|uniref:hypothetical protein n=1 Tax=Pseudonocardia sp. TaxID=60912 RepID=UPI00261509C8|nr:hypothetical protein [Pseudonocardia sp.]MCW2722697.1 hypothetical protein [Pseudonocardia sp.]
MAVPPVLGRLTTLGVTVLTGLLLVGTPAAVAADPPASSGVDAAALPAPARESLPLITDLTATTCPELPPLWVVAQVQAESGWDAGLHADTAGGAAGLYQFGQRAWIAAGGAAWPSDPPPADAPALSADAHLRVAVPWICANLRAVTAHLKAAKKTAAPLDAMLVCHIAGCGRVTGSRTGIPAAGQAGCAERCAQVIARYIHAVHVNLERFAAPVAPAAAPAPAPAPAATPAAWTGGSTGCRPPDPTRKDGCLTGAARHGLEAVAAAFGDWTDGPLIHSTGCWDAHAWNPGSDHSKGRACDFMVTRPGTFAAGAELDHGWTIAKWLRTNAGPLAVKYLIWQGRYWDPGTTDDAGSWGTRYTGGGVYDVRDATGGHYDHVHVSFRE